MRYPNNDHSAHYFYIINGQALIRQVKNRGSTWIGFISG